jgi:hypothetical protein
LGRDFAVITTVLQPIFPVRAFIGSQNGSGQTDPICDPTLLSAGFPPVGGLDLSPLLKPDTAKEVLGLLAAATVAILPLGFLISSVSILLIRLLARFLGKPTYEPSLTDAAYGQVWTQVHAPLPKDKTKTLYAVATFDHELLTPGVHTWLMRRWNAFNTAAHSAVALFLAHVMASYFHIPQTWRWVGWTALLFVLLVLIAVIAWRETMAMIEFQASRDRQRPIHERRPSRTQPSTPK